MESQEEPNTVCTNCEKSIAESKFFLHEAYCFRNIIRCSKCNEPIHKNEVDVHDNDVHRLTSCRFCRGNFEANQIKSHMENCTQKPKMCSFCKCEISSEEFNDHAYQCGSRTRKCDYCNKNVLVRDLEDHETICAVEQFSRGTAGTREDEEVKQDLLEGMLAQPRHKQPAPDKNKLIFKRGLDTLSRDVQKKKLTKLADKRTGYEDKTQEEIDDELAQALNREFYEGGQAAKHRQGRGKLVLDDDDDEDGDEVHDLIEEKPREKARIQTRGAENNRQAGRAQTMTDARSNVEKQLDDDFFGVKKNTRSKMEVEKEDDGVVVGRRTRGQAQNQNKNQNQNQNQQGGRLKRNAAARAQPSYHEQQEDDEPENFEEFGDQLEEAQHDQDPELAQFLSEDAELQRAIQASLEHQ